MTLFTVGHSTHEPDEFLRIVQGIEVVVDVRSHPTSRWPQWRLETMRDWLPAAGIEVDWRPALGGWTSFHYEPHHEAMAAVGVDLAAYSKGAFPKQRIGADRPGPGDGPAWTNQGLYDYAWYASLPEFLLGLDRLVSDYAAPDAPHAALMCCEALWWKCHRSMIADALWERGVDALHIKPRRPARPTTARWERHSDRIGNRLERYPDRVRAAWALHAVSAV